METTTLDTIRTRPRFRMTTELNKEEYTAALKKYLTEHSDRYSGNINSEIATISVKTPADDYWKPFLSLKAEYEDDKTLIRGTFGPSSSVWTFFMFLYFFWTVLWMVFITLWFVGRQIKSEEYTWALGVSFIPVVLALLTYLGARYGQSKAKNEMELLRKFAIESTLPFEKTDLPH